MKYKKLNKEQLKISIDRLTRFKNTKEKYLRVFTDIIISNLIEPKYKKQELVNMKCNDIRDIAVKIINNSIDKYIEEDFYVNQIIKNYENSIFINDIETQDLLNNRIFYNSILDMLQNDNPINIQWLKSIKKENNMISMREVHSLKFPVEKIILVEGITEEILLPAFSRYLGYDFYQKGIQVIPAGGKNQVVKMYYKLSEELKLPIFLLLDKDAEENITQIRPKLRKQDKIHLVTCGEFEDLLPKSLIIKTLNSKFENLSHVTIEDFNNEIPNVKNLENIYKNKGTHEFKKAEFAKLIRNNINEDADISTEIIEIIKEISNKNKTLDSQFCS